MHTIEEVEAGLDHLSRGIDETVARIQAGYVLIEQMKQQMKIMREKLSDLKQMKRDAENNINR